MLGKFFKRWVRTTDGTTSIEFSLLAIPYVILTVGIIEVSIMYASASLLEGATSASARLIRTGQIQQAQGANPEEMFRERLCGYATVLIACGDVAVDVLPMASYASFDSMAPQFDDDGNMISQGFDAGGSNDRILVRTSYRYRMITPFVGVLLGGADGSRLFISTIVLQTEPYDFDAGV